MTHAPRGAGRSAAEGQDRSQALACMPAFMTLGHACCLFPLFFSLSLFLLRVHRIIYCHCTLTLCRISSAGIGFRTAGSERRKEKARQEEERESHSWAGRFRYSASVPDSQVMRSMSKIAEQEEKIQINLSQLMTLLIRIERR